MKIIRDSLYIFSLACFVNALAVAEMLFTHKLSNGQAFFKITLLMALMLITFEIAKNAPKVLEHLKRATRKTIIFILRNIRGKVNEQF